MGAQPLAVRDGAERTVICTYCLKAHGLSAYSRVGEHVIPAAMGGGWADRRVCRECNTAANQRADEKVIKDPVVLFLRSAHGIADRRNGEVPKPPRVRVETTTGSIVLATLTLDGLALDPAFLSAGDAAQVRNAQGDVQAARLQQIVDGALGRDVQPMKLARSSQRDSTPTDAWSRFVAKVGLACGREAYGDEWLVSRWARDLSYDLLHAVRPQSRHIGPYPPVEPSWPWEAPTHRLWIEDKDETAVLMMLLFGQVWAGVALNDSGRTTYPSAWSLSPTARTVARSTYSGMFLGVAGARANRQGHNTIIFGDAKKPFIYIEDGPSGPADMGGNGIPVQSPQEAIDRVFGEGPPILRSDGKPWTGI